MLDCLQGYIGLSKGCDGVSSSSGLFLDQLEGISLRGLDSIANVDQADLFGVFSDIEARAVETFTSDFRGLLQRSTARIKTNVNNYRLPSNLQATIAPQEDIYKGVHIEIEECDTSIDNYRHSNLRVIEVPEVNVWCEVVTSAVPLIIFDTETEERLFETTFDAVNAGWQTVTVDRRFDRDSIFICVDARVLGTRDNTILNYGYFNWRGSCPIRIRGASSDVAGPLTLANVSNTFGVRPTVNTLCTFDAMLCDLKSSFKVAFWYKLGIEFAKERIYTERLNAYTSITQESAKDLHANFETQYSNEMQLQTENISINTADCCLECSAPIVMKSARV